MKNISKTWLDGKVKNSRNDPDKLIDLLTSTRLFEQLNREWLFDKSDKREFKNFCSNFSNWKFIEAKECALNALDKIYKWNNNKWALSSNLISRLNFWKFAIELAEKEILDQLMSQWKFEEVEQLALDILIDINVNNVFWDEYWRNVQKWRMIINNLHQRKFDTLLKEWKYEDANIFSSVMINIMKWTNIFWDQVDLYVQKWMFNISFVKNILENKKLISNSGVFVNRTKPSSQVMIHIS